LNPRWAFTHTTFRELHLRPLGHVTVKQVTSLLKVKKITDKEVKRKLGNP
jgi:hypothetical protein